MENDVHKWSVLRKIGVTTHPFHRTFVPPVFPDGYITRSAGVVYAIVKHGLEPERAHSIVS